MVCLIRHGVDMRPERTASRSGKRLDKASSVLGFDDMPTCVREELLESCHRDTGDDAVEALAVEIYDHAEVAKILSDRVGDRLPDVALVEFGISYESDESSLRSRSEMSVYVAPRGSREERGHSAEAHRAGGEIGDIRVLGARRIGLESTPLAQCRQI